MNSDHPRLGAVIAEAAADGALRGRLVARMAEAGRPTDEGRTFSSGGCLVFALAAHATFGGTLVGAHDDAGRLLHVALRLSDGRCLDAEGVSSPEALVEAFAFVGAGAPRLTPIDEPTAAAGFITDPLLSTELAAVMNRLLARAV